ncbi:MULTISPECIES: YutD-like domain-containing protein [unclassified Streptococcus]|uniref:YutD family protein n=1 Tax=unclassified Streptococcus TaxID=2608887 RepID=UPI0010723292|nr:MULTISPECIES: YutD-like domain-containing protein [unclassified Streptococcus]MBF0788109.1 DUF1027 domain-containing protein [Streptococcus sp. 19428wC2_LYSM12]MCQ9212074.1 DUF1027 domain-containing protein [Streptococcus sp. B01]MCQ9213403.1 DUF1027 domain-containing protein [Streptococcus sp. O1]TFV04824.1 DUF1027 domain-containing protein [Streptococcus sp. LYSM12]
MKKEVAPELYNYNKFPGPSFARVGDKVVAETIELDLLEDYRDAFDQTAFGQRFSPLMLKFDYIVGDWGNEQLRLKGFYKDERVVKSDLKISRLDDYLTEFCNFGCAYFVLGNDRPQEPLMEVEERPHRKRRSRSNRKPQRSFTVKEKGEKNHQRLQQKNKPERNKKQNKKKNQREPQESNRSFVIRQK